MIEQRIGHYKILDRLGSGGMGVVWLAQDEQLGRKVALKTLREDVASSPEKRARFDREARAVAALNHPNIVTLYSTDLKAEPPYLVMEYVDGITLDEAIPSGGLPSAEVLRIGADIADALAAAHAHGIVHRDLKPGNVLLAKDGRVKVVDFGLARALEGNRDPLDSHTGQTSLTQEGLAVGTLHYMSPEQLQLRRVDHRTDLFSLGVVLFEMATGELPFAGESAAMVISAMLRDKPRRIDERQGRIAPQIADLVDRLLAKDPADRPPSAAAVRDELDAAYRLLHSETEAMPAPRSTGTVRRPRYAPPRSWSRWAAVGGGAVLIALMAGLGLHWASRAAPHAGAGVAQPEVATLAVLPLKDFSGDPDYFTDGMTDTLINALARMDGIRVISRQSSMLYKKSDKTLPQIAAELHVDYLVEGSVSRGPDGVELRARLMKPDPEESVWASNFSRPGGEALLMNDEAARAIAAAVNPAHEPPAPAAPEASTMSADEFDRILRAQYFGNQLTPKGLHRSLDLYREIVDQRPDSARAWAGLALGYGLLGFFDMPADEASAGAEQAVERALAIDSSLADAHATKGFVLQFYRWDWAGAEAAYRRTLELNPSDASTHHRLWSLLASLGRWQEAEQELQAAHRLDPLSVSIMISLGQHSALRGDYETGIREIRRALVVEPENGVAQIDLWWIYHRLRRDPERGETLVAALRDYGLTKQADDVEAVLTTRGYESALARAAEDVAEEAGRTHLYAFTVAQLFAAAGRPDEAISWLRRGFVERAPEMHWIGVDDPLKPLRGRPEFQELLRGLRLEAQDAPPIRPPAG